MHLHDATLEFNQRERRRRCISHAIRLRSLIGFIIILFANQKEKPKNCFRDLHVHVSMFMQSHLKQIRYLFSFSRRSYMKLLIIKNLQNVLSAFNFQKDF